MKQATIHTDFGTMTARFFPDVAPQHVDNFLSLAEDGFYDGVNFHRIVADFMKRINWSGKGARAMIVRVGLM